MGEVADPRSEVMSGIGGKPKAMSDMAPMIVDGQPDGNSTDPASGKKRSAPQDDSRDSKRAQLNEIDQLRAELETERRQWAVEKKQREKEAEKQEQRYKELIDTLKVYQQQKAEWQRVVKGGRPQEGVSGTQGVALNNRFRSLQVEPAGSEQQQQQQQRNVYVPSVFARADSQRVRQVLEQNDRLKNGGYTMKSTGGGRVRIRPATVELQDMVTTDLKAAGVGSITFARKDEIEFKAVVRGMSDLTDEEVKHWLTGCDELVVKPIYVRRLTRTERETKKIVPANDFVVSFPPGTTMAQVQGVTVVNKLLISWRVYYPSKRKPRCLHCQEWGHTKARCNMPVKCAWCAEPHSTEICPWFKRTTPKAELTCGSCGVKGHPAGDMECVKAMEYFKSLKANQERQAIRNGNNARSGAQQQQQASTRWAKRNQKNGEIRVGEGGLHPQGAWAPQQQETSALEEIVGMLRNLEQRIEKNSRVMSNMATVFGRRLNLQTSDIQNLFNGGY